MKVRINIDPSDGSPTFRRAHANIINTGMGTLERGDYYAHFYVDRKLVRTSHVTDWPRLERDPWDLLAAALDAPNLATKVSTT